MKTLIMALTVVILSPFAHANDVTVLQAWDNSNDFKLGCTTGYPEENNQVRNFDRQNELLKH